jgi:photosystem II stability/assembly factor-like uncharacterized protein
MRPVLLALAASALLSVPVRAADLRHFEDAALHAVQFVDKSEGWAVGDDGVIWHTIDGGRMWERQPSGVRASLRGLHFLNPYTGYVVGREPLPHGGGSVGVVLVTRDGGESWKRVTVNMLPGLNRVRFFDDKQGIVIGDGCDQFATGIFTTRDGGRSWKPLPGPRCPSWLAADFSDPHTGALAGAWGRLAALCEGKLVAADVDTLGGRTVHALQLAGPRAVAVGQGGLVLISSSTGGLRWGYADLKLPPEVLACCDFRGVQCHGDHIWIVGRPGSVVLHSADRGQTWQLGLTGQSLPLNGVWFLDAQHGWAVGEMGTVLGTTDGGKTWLVQRRGGQRLAALLVHARSSSVPLDTVALLGADDGYLTGALQVTAADPSSSRPQRATEAQALASAARQVGGAAGEVLWQFPVPEHLDQVSKQEVLAAWDRLHGDRAAEQVLRQLVLALRLWQPEVVVTDAVEGPPVESLVAEAVQEACRRAADPTAFPEQIEKLGLKPCRVAKVYGRHPERNGAAVVHDLNEARPRLEATVRDFTAPAAALLADAPVTLPAQRCYRLLASKIDGAAGHRQLMQGITLGEGGTARRELPPLPETEAEMEQVIRSRRNLQVLAELPATGLTDPERLLGQLGQSLASLPDDQAAAAAFTVASHFARCGQWTMAQEAFLLMVDRYPAHPLAADAYRWLVRHNSSSEARRRQEMGQFMVVTHLQPRQAETPPGEAPRGVETVGERRLALLSNLVDARKWYQGCLQVESRLAAFGPLYATDPAVQFCLQSARRNLGDFESAQKWYARFTAEVASGPWREAAAAELWLVNRSGAAPKPVATCRQTSVRPFLDGNFDDECWQGLKPLVLRNAVGDTAKDHLTEAWLAYDRDFLYLALRCRHPADRYVPPVKVRSRDADLRPYDRVTLMLDLDRDYSTCFQLHMDQRGCVCEDCWGDRTWNPRWFVAVRSEATWWQIEAAIPLRELTGEPVTAGRAWACNLVRILPGRGVQALSLPADVQPRPEGMGLLLFTQEASPQAGRNSVPHAN